MSPRKADPPTLEFVLLGLLRAQPAHGYELFHSLRREEGIGMIWQLKPARLYALLDKLEQIGWLESTLQSGEGFLPRKQYRVTAAGEQAFQAWMVQPVSAPHRLRQEFLARLYFALQDPALNGPQIIHSQTEICRQWQETIQTHLAYLPADARFEQEVLRFRLGQIQAMQAWLAHLQVDWIERET